MSTTLYGKHCFSRRKKKNFFKKTLKRSNLSEALKIVHDFEQAFAP